MKYANLRHSPPAVRHEYPYNIRAVCRFLGPPDKPLHHATIYRWVARGILQFHVTSRSSRPFLYGWEILELWWRASHQFIYGRMPPPWPSPPQDTQMAESAS